MATLTYDAIRPVSQHATQRRIVPSYGVINFNGADEILSEENYASSNALVEDLFNRISNLSTNFEMINLYFPTDVQGRWLVDGQALNQICKESNVRYSLNRTTQMWRFIPMDVSIFQRVYDWQQVFQFVFYPKCTMGTWNLDHKFVQLLAEQGRCDCKRPPEEGIWTVEPWAKADHKA